MKLFPTVFRTLYEEIYRLGLIAEHGGKTYPGAKSKFSKKLWYEKGNPEKGETNHSFFHRYFTGFTNGDNEEYFYRIYNQCSKLVTAITIDDLSLYKAFIYIGYKHDDEQTEDASIFMPLLESWIVQFIRKNSNKINEANLKQGDKIGNDLRFVTINNAELELPPKTSKHESTKNEELVADVVNIFYNALGHKNYKLAWEQLAQNFQKRVWKESYKRFEDGYINNNGLRNIHVFHIFPRSENTMDCQIYYEDEIIIHTSSELNAISLTTVRDLEDFIRHLSKLKAKIEKSGGIDFDKIELYKILEPTAAEYLWYTCKVAPERVGEVFHVDRLNVVKRLMLCTCHKIEGNWKIESIRELKTYSLR